MLYPQGTPVSEECDDEGHSEDWNEADADDANIRRLHREAHWHAFSYASADRLHEASRAIYRESGDPDSDLWAANKTRFLLSTLSTTRSLASIFGTARQYAS